MPSQLKTKVRRNVAPVLPAFVQVLLPQIHYLTKLIFLHTADQLRDISLKDQCFHFQHVFVLVSHSLEGILNRCLFSTVYQQMLRIILVY